QVEPKRIRIVAGKDLEPLEGPNQKDLESLILRRKEFGAAEKTERKDLECCRKGFGAAGRTEPEKI
ncbi:8983_t:CDS:2, partial [Racocetra persica]